MIADQFIDRTFAREKSFFGPGFVAHVSMAHPVCPRSADALADGGARSRRSPYAEGGTYLCMEGPQFSTLAESNLYRSWGCTVIGMTAMPEAKLAREAELPYALVAMVTDYDCWHEDHDHVTVDQVIKVLHANADKARALVMARGAQARAGAQALAGHRHRARHGASSPRRTSAIRRCSKLDAVAGGC